MSQDPNHSPSGYPAAVPLETGVVPSRRGVATGLWAYVSLVGLILLAMLAFVQLSTLFYSLFTVVVFALLLSYLLYLPVNGLEWLLARVEKQLLRWHWLGPASWLKWRVVRPRLLAVLLVYGGALVLSALAVTVVLPLVFKQFGELARQLPGLVARLEAFLNHLLPGSPVNVERLLRESQVSSPTGAGIVRQYSHWLSTTLFKHWGQVTDAVGHSFSQLLHVTALVLLSFYALLDGRRLLHQLPLWLPDIVRQPLKRIAERTHFVLLGFIKGQVLLALLTGSYMFVVYMIFGIKNAFLLALWLALAELIPIAGTWLGITPALLYVALIRDPMTALYVFLCSYAYQTVKDNVIYPKISADIMGLHPVVVIVALLAGAKLAGFLGVLLALPLVSLANLLLCDILALVAHRPLPPPDQSPKNVENTNASVSAASEPSH